MKVQEINFLPELQFSTSRSGGSGGQHVNKVETKVELSFDIPGSALLTDAQKQKLLEKLRNKINAEGVLKITSGKERSQIANKKIVIGRFYELLEKALKPQKKRRITKPSKAAKEKRLQEKKQRGEKKKLRGDDFKDYLK